MELSSRVKLEPQWEQRKKFVKNGRLLSANGFESNTRLLSQVLLSMLLVILMYRQGLEKGRTAIQNRIEHTRFLYLLLFSELLSFFFTLHYLPCRGSANCIILSYKYKQSLFMTILFYFIPNGVIQFFLFYSFQFL